MHLASAAGESAGRLRGCLQGALVEVAARCDAFRATRSSGVNPGERIGLPASALDNDRRPYFGLEIGLLTAETLQGDFPSCCQSAWRSQPLPSLD
jgi:hypothetical protein